MLRGFLIRRFIPHHERTEDPSVRFAYANLSGRAGIACNAILFGIKIALGLWTGALSIVADAIHNLADAGASVVTLFGFHLAAKPPDAEHPFGHGRIEYVTGLIIAAAILLVGAKLLESSLGKILHPEAVHADGMTLFLLGASIGFQLWLGKFNQYVGEQIHSEAIKAAATDSLSDSVATLFVISGLALHVFFGWHADGWAGLIVAFFILHSGWNAARDTLQPLLGQPPDPKLVQAIEKEVLEHKYVCGVHDLIIHDYGPGRAFASVHVEVPATMEILKAHAVMDAIEEQLHRDFHMVVTVHMDPVVMNDPETNALRERVEEIVKRERIGEAIHDFRLTTARDGGKKLIFDVVVKPNCQMGDREIRYFIQRAVQKIHPNYRTVARIDRFFF